VWWGDFIYDFVQVNARYGGSFFDCIVVLRCNKHLIKSSMCHFFQMVLDCQFEVKYIHDNIIQQTYTKHIVMNF
jgi:hypothetical protein